MVLNAEEAKAVIAKRDATGKTVVVGFQGGLSPEVQKAKAMVKEGEIGKLTSVAATVHQNWKELASGTWRVEPEISGGGFLFDTGSHLINTMVHVVESDVEDLNGILDYCGMEVEINAALHGRFANGVLFSISMSGDTYGCDGYIDLVGTKGIIRLGMWGHVFQKTDKNVHLPMEDLKPENPDSSWKTFNAILDGEKPNTSPPEVGLRFAHLMDLVRKNCKVIP
jgi:predicted dehydrogenase